MKNNITKAVYGDGTVAKSFAGLKAFVTADGLGIVGGIDATTWTFWKNQFQAVARATGLQYPALKAGMNALWMKLIRGAEKPDLIVADGEIYSTYESGLQENQRYADAKLGSPRLRDAEVQVRAAGVRRRRHRPHRGLLPQHQIYEVRNLLGPEFRGLDLPDQSPDMDAVTRHLAFMGALTLSNRSMQGRLTATGT